MPPGRRPVSPLDRLMGPLGELPWRIGAFEFTERLRAPGPGGRITHAQLAIGAGAVMLGAQGAEFRPPGGREVSQYVLRALSDPKPWERACREGWEGVIAKRRDSPYEHRRSPHWLRMKGEATQELVVGGFTDPMGKRLGLGALLVGYFERDEFVFAGKVGTGFDTKLLLDLRRRLDALAIAKPPFTRAVGLPRLRVHWVRPEIVVQVAFIEWTVHGKLRHSRLRGVRTDKSAREVTRESP